MPHVTPGPIFRPLHSFYPNTHCDFLPLSLCSGHFLCLKQRTKKPRVRSETVRVGLKKDGLGSVGLLRAQGVAVGFGWVIFIWCIWAFCLHASLCFTWVPSAQGGQKRASDPQKLELQMIMWGAVWELGTKPRSSEGAAGALSLEPSFQPQATDG